MSKMCVGYNSVCRFCTSERETFFHFITDCPALWKERENVFSERFLEVEELPNLNADKILEFAREPRIEQALEQYEEELLPNV